MRRSVLGELDRHSKLHRVSYVTLIVSALVLATANLVWKPWAYHGPSTPYKSGDAAPQLTLVRPEEGMATHTVSRDESLVVFFSTECIHCLRSLEVYRRIASTRCGLEVAFVVLDRTGPDLLEWWSQNTWDPSKVCAQVVVGTPAQGAAEFRVVPTPTHLLINEGKIQQVDVGALTQVPDWLGP